jgi:two-component system osmolarity sensor histidine kinase EnvZ
MKRLLPTSLFGRALLILIVPMILTQLVVAHVFYDRHWRSVERHMTKGVIGDMAWLYTTFLSERIDHGAGHALMATQVLGQQLGVQVALLQGREMWVRPGEGKRLFPEFYRNLETRLLQPISMRIDPSGDEVHVRVAFDEGALEMTVPRKSISSSTTTIFMLWMLGSSLLFTCIAVLFLRNQVRPIVALAHIAEKLGLGQEVKGFRPRGASEVRRAGRAFLMMAERIRRQVQNRTEMLAGISHDLRTPLTRMRLEMELATALPAATREAMQGDLEEMERMINEYLDFARGDAGEGAREQDLSALLAALVADYQRSGRAVQLEAPESLLWVVRPQALRRALGNIIDNALRYGGGIAEVTLEASATFARIKVTDQGPGIAAALQEEVFKPFTRGEPSRNAQTGGVGLGLAIARSIAQAMGGDVTLDNRTDATGAVRGLAVTLRLPRAVQPVLDDAP